MKGPESNEGLNLPDHREKIPYTERSILVLGGSSGIGLKALAEFSRIGAANVYVGTRSLENFNKARDHLAKREKLDVDSLSIHPFHADVTDKTQIAKAAQEIRSKGLGITDVIFSQAGGMETYMKSLFTDYMDPITEHTFNTPIYELPEDKRRIVEDKLGLMRLALAQWTEDAMAHTVAVNYQGTFHAIDVLGEIFPNGFTGVFYNSTWGELSGVPSIEIPLLYRPVDRSKAMVRDRLKQQGAGLAKQGIHMAEIVASLVNDTKVGKMFNDFFINLMDKEQKDAIVASSIQTQDVVRATKQVLDTDPLKWSTYPHILYVYKKGGQPVVDTSLELSAMYTTPYRF